MFAFGLIFGHSMLETLLLLQFMWPLTIDTEPHRKSQNIVLEAAVCSMISVPLFEEPGTVYFSRA